MNLVLLKYLNTAAQLQIHTTNKIKKQGGKIEKLCVRLGFLRRLVSTQETTQARRGEEEQGRWARRSRSGRRRRRRRSAAACSSTEPASGGPSRRTPSSARSSRPAPTSTSRYLPLHLCRRFPVPSRDGASRTHPLDLTHRILSS